MRVSVIVPMYNPGKFLVECLDSLLAQTYKDVEIVCVDDGSTDGSAEVVERYMSKHFNIRLEKQNNAGAGAARNRGLSVATGDYFAFCDPDDCYKPEMLEKLVASAESEHADIAITRWEKFNSDTGALLPTTLFLPKIRSLLKSGAKSFAPEDFADCLFNIIGHSVCDKLFRRELIDRAGIRFQPIRRTNDLFFSTMAMACSRRIALVDEPLYRYRKGIKSTTSNDAFAGMFCVGCRALKERLEACGRFDFFKPSFINMVVASAKFDLTSITDDVVLRKKWTEIRGNVLDLVDGWDMEKYPPEGNSTLLDFFLRLKRLTVPLPRARVSTIITTYNHAPFIAKAIESVVMQRGIEQEIIISDDGSTDGTAEIVDSYACRYPDLIKNVSSKHNLGISENMRKCLSVATGEFVAILEGDDYWSTQEKLMRQVDFLRDTPECSMVFSRISAITRKSSVPRLYRCQDSLPKKISGTDMFVNGRCGGVCLNFSTCMYRREHLMNLPELLFESRLSELSLSYYMETKGPLGYISTPLSIYRDFGLGTWTSADAFDKYLQRIKCREQAMMVCRPELVPAIKADIIKTKDEFSSYMNKLLGTCRTLEKRVLEAEKQIRSLQEHEIRLRKDAKCVQQRLADATCEVRALKSSESYRMGLFITWPLRKTWRGFKCLRENGLKYTIKHTIGKFLRLFGSKVKW